MFDIMQIKTSFMRGMLSKLISLAIKTKFGYKIKVDLEDIDIKIDEENAHIHVNGSVDMKVDDLKKFTKVIISEDEK